MGYCLVTHPPLPPNRRITIVGFRNLPPFKNRVQPLESLCGSSAPQHNNTKSCSCFDHQIISVKEIHTCHYEVEVFTPLICANPAYRFVSTLSFEWDSDGLYHESLNNLIDSKRSFEIVRERSLFIAQGGRRGEGRGKGFWLYHDNICPTKLCNIFKIPTHDWQLIFGCSFFGFE